MARVVPGDVGQAFRPVPVHAGARGAGQLGGVRVLGGAKAAVPPHEVGDRAADPVAPRERGKERLVSREQEPFPGLDEGRGRVPVEEPVHEGRSLAT